jgi:SAM-dependent methyltransferase
MLNRAARYFPIIRELRRRLRENDSILEIGSGPFGIGEFYRHSFIGCDVSFPCQPKAPMLPIIASATNLPFRDQSFDAVVVSDVLEHVPPDSRDRVIREALRVTRKLAIFGFPCGPHAFENDRKLFETYDRRQKNAPIWLVEHMRYKFPTEDVFDHLEKRWDLSSFGNENLNFHFWVMCREMSPVWNYLFSAVLRIFPQVTAFLLRGADREPYYRMIFVLEQR